MRTLVIGTNPSKYNRDPDVPFKGARCEPRLKEWLEKLEIKEPVFMNVSNRLEFHYPRDFDCEAFKKQVATYKVNRVLALGRIAQKACKAAGIIYYPLPHPSGLNRKLNDKNFLDNILWLCYSEYLYPDCKSF